MGRVGRRIMRWCGGTWRCWRYWRVLRRVWRQKGGTIGLTVRERVEDVEDGQVRRQFLDVEQKDSKCMILPTDRIAHFVISHLHTRCYSV
jgi:hypothetical protein